MKIQQLITIYILPAVEPSLRGCLHYGGAMSGSISYPRVDGVAGYGTTLGIVNYISDKVFLDKKKMVKFIRFQKKKLGLTKFFKKKVMFKKEVRN